MKLSSTRPFQLFFTFPLTLFLFLSLSSASFYDPTFFHQLHPHGNIQNWLGIMGALIGGSLLEIFGPVAFLLPWFVFKLSTTSLIRKQRSSQWFYMLTLLVSLSVAQAMWDLRPDNSFLLLHVGYVGYVGAQWLQQTLPSSVNSVLIGFIGLGCCIKLFRDLPFLLIGRSFFGLFVVLPLFLLQHLQTWVEEGRHGLVKVARRIFQELKPRAQAFFATTPETPPNPLWDSPPAQKDSSDLSDAEIEANFIRQLDADFNDPKKGKLL